MRASGADKVIFDQLDDTGTITATVTDGVATLEGTAGFVHALAAGAPLRVVTRNNAPTHDYIQRVEVDGEPWRSSWLPHDVVAAGPRIDIDLGPEPSDWFTEAPPSRSEPGEPTVLLDVPPGLWGSAEVTSNFEIGALFDDDSATAAAIPAGGWIEWSTAGDILTLTAAEAGLAPDRWRIWGRTDGQWHVIDERQERFEWDLQTRPFTLPGEGIDAVRVEFPAPGRLAEVDLLSFRTLRDAGDTVSAP